MNQQPIQIIIVDDHDLFREGVKFVLSRHPNFSIAGEAANGVDLLELLDRVEADLVLMDIDMPRMNGFEATEKALARHPHLKIITLSMHGDQAHYLRMIEAGVKGFVLKDAGSSELVKAIEAVALGDNYFSQELLMNIILTKKQAPSGSALQQQLEISARELDVLELVCQACTNAQIAEKLFISPKTVEGHKAKLMQKTGANNAVALVLFAIKNRLIEL
ncbi:response regulator transcription factor [Roseimarinus sediminis]|uniref:response regulator n=1 Tax=Roseimarinus sediminis TaxID=1610899 RepID=UPI003D1E1662